MKNEEKNKTRYLAVIFFLCICVLSVFGTTSIYASSSVEQTKVKVGYFESEGYHIKDEEGIMSGYGYDFLQMMLRYNDWQYEYVGYDLDWGEMLSMLDEGKIDLLTLVNKTPEREQKYAYSSQPIGISSTIMTMSSKNQDITLGDYSTYNGKQVGLVKNSSHNEKFEAYARKNGFAYEAVYYQDVEELLADLRAQKNIDIAVTSNMRQVNEETIMDEFDAASYYVITRKDNEKLLDGINEGIRQLDVYSQDWRNTLFKKYYSNINGNSISLSVDERDYIQDLKESGTVLKAAMNPELKPYSYFENGQAKGIAADIFKEIASRLEISYEILPSESRGEYKEQLQSGTVDIDLTAYMDYSIGQKYNLKETDAYMSTSLAMLYTDQSDIKSENHTVATVDDPTEFYGFNKELIYPYHYTKYQSLQACVDAVKAGKADVTFCYVYMAEQAVAADYTNKLQYSILQDSSFGLSLGVLNQEDHRLLSILNKSVGSLDKDMTDKIMLEDSAFIQEAPGLNAFVYSNPLAFITVVAVLLFGLFVIFLLYIRWKNQKRQLLASYEFQRFVGYVCESYDQIEEINLKKKLKRVYQQDENGKLEIREEPYTVYDHSYFQTRVAAQDVERMTNVFSEITIQKMWKNKERERLFDCQVKDSSGSYQWYTYIIKIIPVDEEHPGNYMIFKKNMQKIKEQEETQRQALRVALENAQKANNAKGLFVSKISHEIRTPLNAIIGYLNIAQEQMDAREQVEHCIRNCKNASSHLLDLINDVLDLSAIENNKIQIANTEFDFKEMVTEICNVYYSQADEKKVGFQIDIHGLNEEKMVGDSLRTKQIMMNLLSNAVKFTPPGGKIQFLIQQITQQDNTNHIRFVVKDNGIGMDEEYQKRLFTPFEQESADTARKYGGSGLGLSITKNLVDLLNGTISVKSKKQEGTEFDVVLPFGRCKQKTDENAVPFHKVRVLIVCGEKEAADYMKSLLKRCGAKVDVAANEEKALKRVKGRKGTDCEYVLCLVDDTDKGADGIEVCRKLLEQDTEHHLQVVPVVYNKLEMQETAYAMGIQKIIEKPLFQSSMVDLLMDLYGNGEAKKQQIPVTDELKGIHILLAEDNEMNMEIAVHILTKAGIIITQAVDGQEAFDKFTGAPQGTYQAILMDIQMPRLNGYDATKEIRLSHHPEGKTIPIIALTANAFSEDVSKALSVGMNAHISKPVDDKKLYQVLSQLLKKENE